MLLARCCPTFRAAVEGIALSEAEFEVFKNDWITVTGSRVRYHRDSMYQVERLKHPCRWRKMRRMQSTALG